jgi:DMSO/TMAO reductase YedYZ molybdopterin-dependent catalytic subunit
MGAGCLALGVSELMAGVLRHSPSLVGAVGDLVIDWLPSVVVHFGIETFGANDKAVLVGGILVVSVLAAAALGRSAARSFRTAAVGFTAFGVVGALAALRDPQARLAAVLASTIVAVTVGVVVLWTLLRVARRMAVVPAAPEAAPAPSSEPESRTAQPIGVPDRRAFLAAAGTVAGGAVVFAGLGRHLARGRATSSRERYRLPGVAQPADSPAAASVDVPGVTPVVVPTDRFYTIDTRLLGPPAVDADRWRLRISGLVERPYELTLPELLAMPMVEEYVTLCCVSNEVGGDLVGNAAWRGVPLAELLQRAGVQQRATQVVGRSVDGFTVGFPTDVVFDGRTALLAVGMNGDLLPLRHGFPARLVVAGLYGYVSATKWLTELELTTWDAFDAYWVPRGWSKRGPIKTQSRIDTVSPLPPVAGPVAVAGVAWAPTRGISRVEVQVDDEPWADATLAAALSDETWRQWVYRWEATAGPHRLRVRATDGRGEAQTADDAPPQPDGATGYHTVEITVRER